MTRRGIPKGPSTWYLREWMAARNLAGWSKATMSALYNHKQDFSPKILKEAAAALGVEPFELLLPPEQANALRALRQHALRVVETGSPLDERTGTHG